MNSDPHVEIQPRSSGVVELHELKEVWYNSLLGKKATFNEFNGDPKFKAMHWDKQLPQIEIFIYTKIEITEFERK